jgi:hypothetical protein
MWRIVAIAICCAFKMRTYWKLNYLRNMKHLNAANKLKTFGMENRKNCSQIIKDEKSLAFHNPHVILSIFIVQGLQGVNQTI